MCQNQDQIQVSVGLHILSRLLPGGREGGTHPALQAGASVQAERHSQLPRVSGDRTEGTLGDVILWKGVGHVFAMSEFLWTEGQGCGEES